jgi:hypothetical protein
VTLKDIGALLKVPVISIVFGANKVHVPVKSINELHERVPIVKLFAKDSLILVGRRELVKVKFICKDTGSP